MAQKDPELKASIPFAFSIVTYCAEGVKNDFKKVVDRFLSSGSVRYQDFLTIWQDMHLYHIFRGRETKTKLKEFTKECLKLACELWIESTDFQVQVCGLYLLYGLYYSQPLNPKSRIRMTLPMWQTVQEFVSSVKENKHYDVEFVYMKLVLGKAFHFVATLSNQNSAATQDYRRLKLLSAQEKSEKEIPTMIGNLLEPDNFLKLQVIDQQYQQMKKNLSGETPDPSLSVIQSNLPEQMSTDVKGFRERRHGAINAPLAEGSETDLSHQAQLKQKASKRAAQRVRGVPKDRKDRYKGDGDDNATNQAVLAALQVQPSRFDLMAANAHASKDDDDEDYVIDEDEVGKAKSGRALANVLTKNKKGKKEANKKGHGKDEKSTKTPRKKSAKVNGSVEKSDGSEVNGHASPKKRGPKRKKSDQAEVAKDSSETDVFAGNELMMDIPEVESPAVKKRKSVVNGKTKGAEEGVKNTKSPKGKAPMKGPVQRKRKSQT